MSLAQEQVPEALFLGLLLELSDNWDDSLPTGNRVVGKLSMRELGSGQDLVLQHLLAYSPPRLKTRHTSRNLITLAKVSFPYGVNLSSI